MDRAIYLETIRIIRHLFEYVCMKSLRPYTIRQFQRPSLKIYLTFCYRQQKTFNYKVVQ